MTLLPQSNPASNPIRLVTEQDVINQIQLELLTLVRVSPDEAVENWQQLPLRIGDWSNKLEGEICRFLW